MRSKEKGDLMTISMIQSNGTIYDDEHLPAPKTKKKKKTVVWPVADLGEEGGGMHPPHQPKHNVHMFNIKLIWKKAISEYLIGSVTVI